MDERKHSKVSGDNVDDQDTIKYRTKSAWGKESLDDGNCNKSTNFAGAFLPVKLSAMVFGMWHAEWKDNTTLGSKCEIACKYCKVVTSTTAYNVIISMSLALNVIRHIIAFWTSASEDPTFRIISGLWIIMGTINVCLLIKSSHPQYGNIRKLMNIMDEKILNLMTEEGILYPFQKLKTYVKIVLAVNWFLTAVTVISLAIVNFMTITPVLESMKMLFIAPIPYLPGIETIVFGLQILTSVAWGVPVPYCILMCLSLKFAFAELNSQISRTVEGNTMNDKDCFKRYRYLHLQLCKCVEILDQDLKYFFANWYIINVPHTCFISFILVNRHLESISITLLLFWLVTGLVLVFVMSGVAATLYETVSLFFLPCCFRFMENEYKNTNKHCHVKYMYLKTVHMKELNA